MTTIDRFEDIEAWQRAREMTKNIYRLTSTGSFARDFGLREQIRRAAVSIMSNIAEGFERGGDKEFIQFISLSKGSCGEVRSHIQLAMDLGHVNAEECKSLSQDVTEIGRMLSGLMKYLQGSHLRGSKYK